MSIANNTYDILPTFIREAIQKEVERVTEEELMAAQKRIEERKSQVIAGVIIHIEKMVEVETLGTKLIVSIRKE